MADVVIVGKNPLGGIIVESNGIRQTIPPSALESYLKSTSYSRSQVTAPKDIDEEIRRHGGGVHITATGTYAVSGGLTPGSKPSNVEQTNITIKPEAQQPEIIQTVEKVSGTKIETSNAMESQKLYSQSVVNQAMYNAIHGTGPDIMLTPQEYSQQVMIYHNIRNQAMNPTFLDILGYAVWDPFMIRTLSAGADAYFQGKSQQERAEIMFEKGMLSYKLQTYHDQAGAIVQSALGGLEIGLTATAPIYLKSPTIRVATSTLGLGASTYNMISEAQIGELKFSSTFLNLATIGLASAGIYSGFNEQTQRKLIDPVLKDINIKEYHEVTVEKTKYVPVYGKEMNYEYFKGETLQTKDIER